MKTIDDLWDELETCLGRLNETSGDGLARWGFRGLILAVHGATLVIARIADAQEQGQQERIATALENIAELMARPKFG